MKRSQKSEASKLQATWRNVSAIDFSIRHQMTIHVGIEKINEMSIQQSNDLDLEMAITDF